ncbi:IQ calmodulin-binding motif-containing protein 1 isoform X1 [Electrophorus electricus]|uniref:IQ motif containing B1 n=2 Tax=Electrophorus electricus TaxID=8005 RepID=A0A4W4FFI3_ELEEL|nr:IQ calmodulin-binding motif-containing protein 1 isoform X1 [Electrophorus electricus]
MEWSEVNKDDVTSNLQSLVAENSERSFTKVLAALSDLLERKCVADQRELERCKQELYHSGVLAYCSAALKLSPAHIEGGHASVTRMADILSACCVGIGPVSDTEGFRHQFLPSVTEHLLYLAHRLVSRAIGERKIQMIRLFRKVFDSLMWILRAYSHLIPCVLQSKHYESVQMTEDDEVSAVTLMMWYNLFRANSTLVSEMGNNPLTSVTDEVVYKMSSSSNPVIGGTAVKVLLLIIEQHRPCIRLLHKHYKGLQELVWKDWRGKGFDSALELLVNQLQPESPEKVSKHFSEERAHAACVIQAAWRAHQTRCRIKKLPRAVSALQRSFRAKRQRQQEDAERRRAEEELRLQVQLRRQRAIRQLRQRQLHLMEILPADQVARYLGEMENRAALLIQRVWRGHRERRRFQQCRYQLRQHKAAVTLQRAILSFLQRRRSRRTVLAPWKGPRGLTDGRRTELRRQIEDHVCLYPSSVVSPEGTLELHEKAQSMLQQHLATRASDRAQEQHRQALLAQINTDLELLLNAPSLKCVGREDSFPFLSRSAPVAMRARQSHNALLQNMRLPWWKTLGGEFSDPASLSQKDYNLDCDSLYLGDS